MKKKAYSKPIVELELIDSEISLIMMTNEGEPPDNPPATILQQDNSSPTQDNSFEENPFGN